MLCCLWGAVMGIEKCSVRWVVCALVLLGTLSALKLFVQFIGFVQGQLRTFDRKKYGDWAVVTGATDGIGLAYAEEFAKHGMNVCLISRTLKKLEDCAADIKKKYPKVATKVIQADFNSSDESIYSTIDAELATVDVGVLVNNVGISYEFPEYMHLLTKERVDSMIRMNVIATTRMTHLILPKMVDRKRGAIVNIGSAAGSMRTGNPLLSVYSATKAYVDFFSKSLNTEYASKGIDVSCHIPYFVTTKLAKIRHASITVPTPAAYAKAAVKAIGSGASVTPVLAHKLQHFLINCVLPMSLVKMVLQKMHLGIRKKAYKKKEATKQE